MIRFVLPSVFIIFASESENKMHLGIKNEESFCSALGFHYLCPKITHVWTISFR